jgi:hypothetical protein
VAQGEGLEFKLQYHKKKKKPTKHKKKSKGSPKKEAIKVSHPEGQAVHHSSPSHSPSVAFRVARGAPRCPGSTRPRVAQPLFVGTI